jgi:mannitol-1-phosphate 5-dehydrogenase
VDADKAFRELIAAKLEGGDKERLARLVGFVRASVGRMVPVMTDAMRMGDILRIWVEAYDHLPVDAEGFVGPMPEVVNMESVSPFELYVQRKLYIHNMGHAAVAYLGYLRGYAFIWEAVGDPGVSRVARAAMEESAAAIAAEHGVEVGPLLEHVEDLLGRFANRKLGDTIERVGRDLPRKLAPRDRLLGAIELCAKHALPRSRILKALAAALLFEDSVSRSVRDQVASAGPRSVLVGLCGMAPEDPDIGQVLAYYSELKASSR